MILEHKIGTHRLVRIENDKQPTYYIYGGMVFNPLTINYLECWGGNWWDEAPKALLSHLQRNWKKPGQEEIVVLNRVLPIEENVGYHDINDVQVVSINGKNITRMKDVVEIIDHNTTEYVDILTAKGSHIILKSKDRMNDPKVHKNNLRYQIRHLGRSSIVTFIEEYPFNIKTIQKKRLSLELPVRAASHRSVKSRIS